MISSIQAFLTRHGFSSQADSDAILANFFDDMQRGLSGQSSSLSMLPAYVGIPKSLKQNHPVWVMDAGGTNLRVASISFDTKGPKIEHFKSSAMPGTQDRVDAKAFYQRLAARLDELPILSKELGICFSYPAQSLPNHDGRVVRMTKELEVDGITGTLVAESISQALKEKSGKEVLHSIVVNDTVADLLAGIALDSGNKYRSYVGFILGTGTNCAYMESCNNIKGLRDDAVQTVGKVMAVNIESGNFNRLDSSSFDTKLDQASRDPGRQVLEKMISGAYLGRLVFEILLQAGSEELISSAAYGMLKQLAGIETKTLNYLLDPALDSTIVFPNFADSDLEFARVIASEVLERAAALTAINISAATISAAKSVSTDDRPICIAADGSTFFKAYSFKERVEAQLDKILGKHGIKWEIVPLNDGPLLGAAVAALTLLV